MGKATGKNGGNKWPWVVGGLGVVGAGVGAWWLMRRKKSAIPGVEDPVQNAAAEAAGADDEQVADQIIGKVVQSPAGNGIQIIGTAFKPISLTAQDLSGPTFTVGQAKAVITWGQGYEDQRRYVGQLSKGFDWFSMMANRYSINPPGVQDEWKSLKDSWTETHKVYVAVQGGNVVHVKQGDKVPFAAPIPPWMNFAVTESGITQRMDENPWGYYISNDRLRKFWVKASTMWVTANGTPAMYVGNGTTLYPAVVFFVRTPKEDEAFGAFKDIAAAISEYFTGDDKSGMLAQGAGLSGDVKKSSRADIQERARDALGFPDQK